jgi:MFS family permease
VSRRRSILLDLGPLREFRDFRIVWLGQLVSNVGRQVTLVALPYQLYILTRSPLAIGALAVVQLVPLLTITLFGGAIADAVDRRRLLLLTQSGLMVTSGCFAILATVATPPIVLIYLVALLAGIVSAVDQPARSSAMYRLVPREQMGKTIALAQAGFQLASVTGPALGGVLIALLGLPVAYAVDSATFGVSVVALLFISPIPPIGQAARPGLAAVREGLRYVRQIPAILGTFVIDLDAMVFGLPVALFPILAVDVYGVGAAGVGLMTSAVAAGALVGALLTGWVSRVRYQGRAVIWAVLAWGLAITLFGLVTFSFPLALLLLAAAGAADLVSAVFRGTILQAGVPEHLRGRLSAIHLMVVTGGPRIGDLEATGVAALVSTQFSVVSGGVLCMLGVALVARRFPQLARYDGFAAARTEQEHAVGTETEAAGAAPAG